MNGFLNINDQNTFLGGQHIQSAIILVLTGYLVYKAYKK